MSENAARPQDGVAEATSGSLRVSFIGLEGLGAPIAQRLQAAGFRLTVSDTDRSRATELVSGGAQWVDTIEQATAQADIVLTYLKGPDVVEDVYLGDDGILLNVKVGSYLVDLSSSSPELASDIYQIAAVNDANAVDAPLLGGYDAYDPDTTTALVGSDGELPEELTKILSSIAADVVYAGGPGKGQAMKVANTIALIGSILGTVESLAYAVIAGLDPISTLATVVSGPSGNWFSARYGATIANDDFDSGIPIEWLISEVETALDSAEEEGLDLPSTETAYHLLDLLALIGGSEKGAQALYLLYSDEARCVANGLDWSRTEVLAVERVWDELHKNIPDDLYEGGWGDGDGSRDGQEGRYDGYGAPYEGDACEDETCEDDACGHGHAHGQGSGHGSGHSRGHDHTHGR